MPVGIYMETDGVMVLGTQEIKGKDGIGVNPAKHLVKEGDYIVGVDSDSIYNKSELIERVKNYRISPSSYTFVEKKCILMYNFIRQKMKAGAYKLGIWVRDNAQGLGTITFLNADSEYGALGHGIHDVDTGKLIEMSTGRLYDTSIQNIKKGENGNPEGWKGSLSTIITIF